MSIVFGRACVSGTCSDPCLPSITSVQCRNRSATKTKCGFDEYVASTPPKKYLTRTLSGSSFGYTYSADDCAGDCLSGCTLSISGSCNYDRITCGESGSATGTYHGEGPCGTITDTESRGPACTIDELVNITSDCGFGPGDLSESLTSSSRTLSFSGVCYAGAGFTEALSSEYTTALLDTDVTNAVLAASWSGYSGTCLSANYSMSDDEMTITKRQAEWKFIFNAAISITCKLLVDVYQDGVYSSTACFNLSSGATSYSYQFFPSAIGDWTLSNWRIVAGSC